MKAGKGQQTRDSQLGCATCSWFRSLLLRRDETIGTKIFIAIFDKLVLGLIILIVGVLVQSRISKDNYRNELTAKMLQTQTELIATYRKDLISQIGEFLTALDTIIQEPNKTSRLIGELEIILNNARKSVQSLSAFYSAESFAVDAAPLVNAMSSAIESASQAGLSGPQRITELKKRAKDVGVEAGKVYGALEKATLAEAIRDAQEILKMR